MRNRESGSERSRADAKDRLQYLAAGTAAPQDAGYGAITGRAAGIVNIYPRRPPAIFDMPLTFATEILMIIFYFNNFQSVNKGSRLLPISHWWTSAFSL